MRDAARSLALLVVMIIILKDSQTFSAYISKFI